MRSRYKRPQDFCIIPLCPLGTDLRSVPKKGVKEGFKEVRDDDKGQDSNPSEEINRRKG